MEYRFDFDATQSSEDYLIGSVAEELFPFFYPVVGLNECFQSANAGRQQYFRMIVRSILEESGSLYGEADPFTIAEAIFCKRCNNLSKEVSFNSLGFYRQQEYLRLAQIILGHVGERDHHA